MWLNRVAFVGVLAASACAAETALDTYRALTRFELTGGAVTADQFRLVRDRVEMVFTGTFYLEKPVAGAVRGAVFIGQGTLRAEPSPVAFERENVRRFLHNDTVESDFKTAILRFSDTTAAALLSLPRLDATPTDEARDIFSNYTKRLLKEAGLNLEARVATSILNGEQPGVFAAQFDKGKLGRFTYVFDPQTRIPSATFGLNAGEKGLLFAYKDVAAGNDLWMAFPSLEDIKAGNLAFSDQFDLISLRSYVMDIDLREANKRTLKLESRIECVARGQAVRAIPFTINDGLDEYRSIRLKRAMRLASATVNGATPVEFIQEDWETGLTLLLPAAIPPGSAFPLNLKLEGDFLLKSDDEEVMSGVSGWTMSGVSGWTLKGLYYPRVNESWYPRHGYLNPSTFDFTFHHRKGTLVVAAGERISEQKAGDEITTLFRLATPVSFVTFAGGEFDRQARHSAKGGIDIEFYGVSGFLGDNKQDFMLTELENAVTFFGQQFGNYPWKKLAGVFHPRPFGQGFPTLLLLAPTSHQTNKYEFSFIAHETSHQWWGDMVQWRSYRDQWLSEGFAEYSAALYTAARMNPDAERDLVRGMRRVLRMPPVTDRGVGKGRVTDIGPIVLGQRLASRESFNAYQALVYGKGALVLRMIHFLLSDPATGQDAAFYEMMRDFVKRHQGRPASTESFRDVAAEHFARSPIARKYGLHDLNWFFRQWVYESSLPTYRVNYRIDGQPDGSVVVRGAVTQENAGENWFMPIPIVFRFGKDQFAKGTINALGARSEFSIKLPAKPAEVQIDPDQWVLSEDTLANLDR